MRIGNAGIARILTLFLFSYSSSGFAIDNQLLSAVNSATFEVVVKKSTKDPLTYEKELPMNLLPFRVRNDKYQSIGSAFAIGDNKFVSAEHVISLDGDTQLGEFFLRDAEGNVYELNNILVYSVRRDFVVFDLKKKINDKFFSVNQKPELNSKIYAAGNALGDGVIVRDGLLTSRTDEEVNGEWKWLRFSAAASPGNSGGPLLDERGAVIGVILRKSESENLNYALPISEVVNHEKNIAHIGQRILFGLDVANYETLDMRDEKVKLPMQYRKLNEVLSRKDHEYYDKLFAKYLAEHGKKMFPLNTKDSPLLYETSSANFPYVVTRNNNDGTWELFGPKKIDKATLGYNGYLQYGRMGSFDYLRIQRPDNVDQKSFYTESKVLMDMILRGFPLNRNIGGQEIRITSLGKAQKDQKYADRYGRQWLVRSWDIPFSDQVVITYMLPIPGGASVFMKVASTGSAYGYTTDMRFMTGFIYQTYYATLDRWNDFLAMKNLLPDPIRKVSINVQYGKHFSFDSDRVSFGYDADVMNITKNSDLHVILSYYEDDHDKVVWDVSSVTVGDDVNSNTFFNVSRKANPPESYGDKFTHEWNSAMNQQLPYNNTAIIDNRRTYIGTSFIDETMDSKKSASRQFVYTATYGVDGTANDQLLKNKLSALTKGVRVTEKAN